MKIHEQVEQLKIEILELESKIEQLLKNEGKEQVQQLKDRKEALEKKLDEFILKV